MTQQTQRTVPTTERGGGLHTQAQERGLWALLEQGGAELKQSSGTETL